MDLNIFDPNFKLEIDVPDQAGSPENHNTVNNIHAHV